METKEPSTWTKTIVASMTSYIDAGSIVAGGAALSLWEKQFAMEPEQVGMLGAFGPNCIGAAIGAFIGGRLCDRYGRKLIYTYDLLFYMLGLLLVIFSVNFEMLIVGYFITGMAVGADVVASWTLIAENAPAENRARHCGSAQVAWALGPAVVLMLSAVLKYFEFGALGSQLVFAHLILIAFITWVLRLRMPESDSWVTSKEKEEEMIAQGVWHKPRFTDLLKGENLKGILFLLGVYTVWNLAAGTWGFFMPYICEKVGNVSDATASGLVMTSFIVSCFATLFIFMAFADRVSRRLIFGVVAGLYVIAWGLFLLPASYMSLGLLITFVVLAGINNGSGQQAFYQMWASELFPARYRASAQGFLFFVARGCGGLWSYCFPQIFKYAGMQAAAGFLVAFALISMLVGTIFTPDTSGKTLEQIETERYG